MPSNPNRSIPHLATFGLAIVLAAGPARAEDTRPYTPSAVVAVTDLDALRRLWIEDASIHDYVDCGDGLDYRDAAGTPPLSPEAVGAMLAGLTRNLSPAPAAPR